MAGEEAPGLRRVVEELRQGMPAHGGPGGQAGEHMWARSSAAGSPSGSSGSAMRGDGPGPDGKGQAASSRGGNGEGEGDRDMG